MSLGVNFHIGGEYVTTVDTHAPSSPTATIKVTESADTYGGVTLFFADLAHVERWVRDVLGQVEVLKAESANDQPKPERPAVFAPCSRSHLNGETVHHCTLPHGHAGDHVADDEDCRVIATWPQGGAA